MPTRSAKRSSRCSPIPPAGRRWDGRGAPASMPCSTSATTWARWSRCSRRSSPATAVERAVAGVHGVFHQAALRSVPRSVDDPLSSNEVNVTGTLLLLLACRRAGVRRVVYASSSSVYGDDPTLPKVETLPTAPISPYAVSKLAAEEYCQTFARLYGVETVSLRSFNVFVPRLIQEAKYYDDCQRVSVM